MWYMKLVLLRVRVNIVPYGHNVFLVSLCTITNDDLLCFDVRFSCSSYLRQENLFV